MALELNEQQSITVTENFHTNLEQYQLKAQDRQSKIADLKHRHSGPIKRVAFVFAMEEEAIPFIESLDLKAYQGEVFAAPTNVFIGKIGAVEIVVSVNAKDTRHAVDRVGTEASVLNAFVSCVSFQPDLLINAGTAGGFQTRGASLFDIFVSEAPVYFHDHRIPLPGFEDYGKGAYPVLPVSNLPETIGAKLGVVSTGNSLDLSDTDAHIISESGALVKEMEAAAVAQVADDQGIAFLAIKSITDLIDSVEHLPQDVFLQNYQLASTQLKTSLCKLVEILSEGKNLEDL